MSRVGRGLISSDDSTGAVTLPSAPAILPQIQGGFGQDVSAVTGSVVFYGGSAYFPATYVTPEMFGGSTSASAATNTTAFNTAIATGKAVYVPSGTYDLNALTKTEPFVMFGDGRSSILRFNTTGVGIECEDLTPDQGQTFYLHDLAFKNVTNVPASFILNRYPVNSRFERLYFSSCAATYCIDNESGYGTKISDCVFSDVTGGGVRMREDSTYMDYSYAFTISECDFTRLSEYAIYMEGSSATNIFGGVIESCKGIYVDPLTRFGMAWNINLYNVHFEQNTDQLHIELNSDNIRKVTMNLFGCHFSDVGPVYIETGDYGRMQFFGTQIGGGSPIEIKGGNEARVFVLSGVENNVTRHSTFTGQFFDLGQYYDISNSVSGGTTTTLSTSAGGAVNLGTGGTLTSHWSRMNQTATLTISVKFGTSPTIGAGVLQFTDSLLTLLPALSLAEAAGSVLFYDKNTESILPGTAYLGSATTVLMCQPTGTGTVTATTPWTWAVDDEIRLTISYRSTAS